MENNEFVIVIDQEGKPHNMFGPYDWQGAFERIQSLLRVDKITLSEEGLNDLESTGEYEYPNGGGIYIVTPE